MDVVINKTCDILPEGSRPLQSQGGYLPDFLSCLGLDPDALPLGDFLAQYHQLQGQWLVAAPIHWEASHNNAMITAEGAELGLSADESKAYFETITEFLAEDGLRLFYHDAHTWLIQVDNKPLLQTRSAFAMLHQPMMTALHDMDDTLYWVQRMTELQMLLSTHPLNQQRALTMNGVWFYGGGVFNPDCLLKHSVMSDDEILIARFPGKIQALSLDKQPTRHTILLIKHPDQIPPQTLSNFVHKHKTRWFWNNTAYTTARSGWWTSLWRS